MGRDSQQEEQQTFQYMPRTQKEEFLQKLKSDYRQILLGYFNQDKKVSQDIDSFIHTSFTSNIPVPRIIEIHMQLVEEFSKQLRLEGRSDEILLDYRLTLIDILAHLCETYRTAKS